MKLFAWIGKLVAFAIVAFIALIAVLFVIPSKVTEKEERERQARPVLATDVWNLTKAFEANEVRTATALEGKRIQIDAVVASVEKNWLDDMVINASGWRPEGTGRRSLSGEDPLAAVLQLSQEIIDSGTPEKATIFIQETAAQKSLVAALEIGQKFRVECAEAVYEMKSISAKQCRIVPPINIAAADKVERAPVAAPTQAKTTAAAEQPAPPAGMESSSTYPVAAIAGEWEGRTTAGTTPGQSMKIRTSGSDFLVQLHVDTAAPCSGELDAKGALVRGELRVKPEESESSCAIVVSFNGNSAELKSSGCDTFSGMRCGFDGAYVKTRVGLQQAGLPQTSGSARPSFDCSKAATRQETMICSDVSLAAKDVELADAFKRARASSSDIESLKASQIAWRKNVRDACVDATCMLGVYEARIVELRR